MALGCVLMASAWRYWLNILEWTRPGVRSQLIAEQWQKIGIKLNTKEIAGELQQTRPWQPDGHDCMER